MIPVLFAMFLYAILHSWLAGGTVKTAFRTRFGDHAYHGFYRLIFNSVGFLTLLPISYLFTVQPDGILWEIDSRYAPILLLIQMIGLIGAIVSLLQIDLLRFLGIRQVLAYLRDEPLPLPEEKLTTTGLYGVVRHPLYLFTILAIFPVTTMTGAYLGFCIGVTLYFAIGSIFEERRLTAAYGDTYEIYRRKVPWLIPLVRIRS